MNEVNISILIPPDLSYKERQLFKIVANMSSIDYPTPKDISSLAIFKPPDPLAQISLHDFSSYDLATKEVSTDDFYMIMNYPCLLRMTPAKVGMLTVTRKFKC